MADNHERVCVNGGITQLESGFFPLIVLSGKMDGSQGGKRVGVKAGRRSEF